TGNNASGPSRWKRFLLHTLSEWISGSRMLSSRLSIPGLLIGAGSLAACHPYAQGSKFYV
ncbi:MAG TPA: hypothetical protein VFQ43_05430, partial [Nitrososphaera sp.]|nr:hypothetical protein [Nitrososphaera sp.]